MNLQKGWYHVNARDFCGGLKIGNKGQYVDSCDRLVYLKRLTAEQLEQEVKPWKLTRIENR
jgi:hypothetical protein